MRYFISIILFFAIISCSRIEPLFINPSKQVVISQSDEHLAFPSVEKLNNGDLVCVFRRGKSHVSPDGNILLSRSKNKGQSWFAADTIISTRLDCRDPSVMELKDGSLLLNFFQSNYNSSGKIIGALGVFVSRSFDGGLSWYSPKMVVLENFDWAACSAKILELKDGTLLLPLYAGRKGEKSTALVAVSRDLGRNWEEFHDVAFDSSGKIDFNEPALCALPDGRIMCILRTAGDGHFQYKSFSKDGGITWSPPERTSLQGQASSLLLTNENILICAYRDFSPNGTSYSVSYDYGTTFEKEFIIHPFKGDRAYPELVQLDDGIFVAYYEASPDHSQILGSYIQVKPPAAPKALKASVSRDSTIALRWNKVHEAYYYQIFRDVSAADTAGVLPKFNGQRVAIVLNNSYTDTNVAPGNIYRYQVEAVSSHSELVKNNGASSSPSKIAEIHFMTNS